LNGAAQLTGLGLECGNSYQRQQKNCNKKVANVVAYARHYTKKGMLQNAVSGFKINRFD
jgi:hypothetical protein